MTTPIAFDYLATQPATSVCGQLLGRSAYYLIVEVDGIPRSYRRDLVAGRNDCGPDACPLPRPTQNKPLLELWLKGFTKQDEAAYLDLISQMGYAVYRRAPPKGSRFTPGFLLRQSQTKKLTYAICAAPVWRSKTVRNMQRRGIVVHGHDAFVEFLRTGVLSALEPVWSPTRVAIAPPKFSDDGMLSGWAFGLGSWALGALCWFRVAPPSAPPFVPETQVTVSAKPQVAASQADDLSDEEKETSEESDAWTGWARPEVPHYAFAEHTIVHSTTGGFSLQIESAVDGYYGWVLLKHYIGNRLQGRLRCRQFEFVQTLQDGEMSRLQPLVSE